MSTSKLVTYVGKGNIMALNRPRKMSCEERGETLLRLRHANENKNHV